jgi:hypothetical protein
MAAGIDSPIELTADLAPALPGDGDACHFRCGDIRKVDVDENIARPSGIDEISMAAATVPE